mgnify:CR=1 FL=1
MIKFQKTGVFYAPELPRGPFADGCNDASFSSPEEAANRYPGWRIREFTCWGTQPGDIHNIEQSGSVTVYSPAPAYGL